MSSPYDPADDAINTVLSGLLPALIFGMFRGFESEKKKKISFINIFDDLIIFGSIVAFPMCTGFELYQYFNVKPNIYGILATLITAILGIFSYLLFLFPRRQINNLNIKILDRLCNPISSTYFFIVSLVLSLYFGYFNLSLITTDYCIINIGFSKLKKRTDETKVQTELTENLIKELADTCKQNVEIEISEQPDPTKVLSNLKNEIIEIEILKDEITGQLENMKKLREEIIKEQLTKKD
uniref:Uncharacterized protein n=1 Tax=Rhizophagus irregularis (strain DAOM 181602 / DAOM 197198 / MUCL 43194) TaxID=747089 RepID=U9TA19_RHIID